MTRPHDAEPLVKAAKTLADELRNWGMRNIHNDGIAFGLYTQALGIAGVLQGVIDSDKTDHRQHLAAKCGNCGHTQHDARYKLDHSAGYDPTPGDICMAGIYPNDPLYTGSNEWCHCENYVPRGDNPPDIAANLSANMASRWL